MSDPRLPPWRLGRQLSRRDAPSRMRGSGLFSALPLLGQKHHSPQWHDKSASPAGLLMNLLKFLPEMPMFIINKGRLLAV